MSVLGMPHAQVVCSSFLFFVSFTDFFEVTPFSHMCHVLCVILMCSVVCNIVRYSSLFCIHSLFTSEPSCVYLLVCYWSLTLFCMASVKKKFD